MTEFLLAILGAAWDTTRQMAPYLLFGFLVAGALSVVISPEFVERHLGGRGLWPVLKAALFGVPLPLCSCGVIPVATSLRRHGASRGATTAFLLSTPQTGVDSILVTYSLLGPVFAVFRPVVAFVTGLLGGWLVDAREREAVGGSDDPPPCEDDCCRPRGRRNPVWRALRYGFVDLPADIGRPLLAGLAVAGLIAGLVPDDFFAGVLGTGIVGMLAMMAVGIPLYVCATASVPIAAALMAKGVSPGAAMVFLVTGPATNAATVATVWKVLGRRTALTYLGVVAVSALGSGLLLDGLLTARAPQLLDAHAHGMLPGWFSTGSAVALLGLLAAAVLRPAARRLFGRLPTSR
jgi:uncharacterized membrane protein YraQ (UPF0718 family)